MLEEIYMVFKHLNMRRATSIKVEFGTENVGGRDSSFSLKGLIIFNEVSMLCPFFNEEQERKTYVIV